jgi:serine phosphatase RsbU (regulator of sigma subunit)/pSer/pThr/pTyr-binding forkhead associated (FHA) protein
MPLPGQSAVAAKAAALVVINPSGNQTRVSLCPLPFSIGRQADNHLVLRDNRASRNHARIVSENGEYFIEDLKSSNGVHVNGEVVSRHKLSSGDRIEFGVQDSYALIFTIEEGEINKLVNRFSDSQQVGGTGGELSKLRALGEVARTLRNSLSTDDVLASVVDAALAVTGSERGVLLLRREEHLDIRVARDSSGQSLGHEDLNVPLDAIQKALRQRRSLLSMTLDPGTGQRSVVCVPLVHVRPRNSQETLIVSAIDETVGLIYLDSRQTAVDLSSGNSELLQTLALEASTVLENARLLEEERDKQRLEEEIGIARAIQESLLPRKLPTDGWFRAAGSSIPSHQVGGDYFDVKPMNPDCWSVTVTDVSGKGVSSALLAALLQGAFLASADGAGEIEQLMSRLNRFLNERTEGEKYATVFYCTLNRAGLLRWTNAGHCTPYLIRTTGEIKPLGSTGMPLGMLDMATYEVEEVQLGAGDKVVAYSDGLSEAENTEGNFFDVDRMKKVMLDHARSSCSALHADLMEAVDSFTEGAVQNDDITAVVIEYQPT